MLSDEFEKDYFKKLEKQLQQEYKEGKEIFPPKDLIFNAFNLTPLDKVYLIRITKTRPCNIQRLFSPEKKENFIRKIGIPLHTPVLLYKSGV